MAKSGINKGSANSANDSIPNSTANRRSSAGKKSSVTFNLGLRAGRSDPINFSVSSLEATDEQPLIQGRAPTPCVDPNSNLSTEAPLSPIEKEVGLSKTQGRGAAERDAFFIGNSKDLDDFDGFYDGNSISCGESDAEEELVPVDMIWSCELPKSREASNAVIASNTNSKTFFLLLKSFIGTGVLFLPKAFSNGGLLFSVVVMIVIGYLTLHCMLLLVECERKVGGGYGEIGHKLYGPLTRKVISISIAVSQMGFACAYFIFIAQNLQALVAFVTRCKHIPPEWACILIQTLLYIPLSWVRQIKHFSLSSLVANVFIVVGLLYVLGYDIVELSSHGVSPTIVAINTEKFPLFIGTSIFAYEGIGLMLPISQAMRQPEVFPWILSVTLLLLGAVMMVIGCAGYLAYGQAVETIAFLNLQNNSTTKFIQFLYVVAIVCSFPLTIYPALRISETYLFSAKSGKNSRHTKWMKNSYRAAVVVALASLAIAGSSSLDKFVSLIGSVACIPLSFIFPALFHVKAIGIPSHVSLNANSYSSLDGEEVGDKLAPAEVQANKRLLRWIVYKDYGIILFGVVALFFSTFITIVRWSLDGQERPPIQC